VIIFCLQAGFVRRTKNSEYLNIVMVTSGLCRHAALNFSFLHSLVRLSSIQVF
jgi:hypothetical protein